MLTAFRAAAVVLAAAAAFAVPAAASAAAPKPALTPGIVLTANGIAGYYDHASGYRMGDVHAQVVLGQAAATAVGTSAVDGSTISGSISTALCDPATGYSVQLAAIYVGNGDWEFAYGGGQLTGGTGNPCLSGVLSGGVTSHLLTWPGGSPVVMPTGDTARMEIATTTARHAVTGRAAIFRVSDSTTGLVDFSTGPVAPTALGLPAWPQYHQAGVFMQLAPVQAATSVLTPVLSVTYAQVADYAGQHQYLEGRWSTTQVNYTSDGTSQGILLGAPEGFGGGHFEVAAAPAVVGS